MRLSQELANESNAMHASTEGIRLCMFVAAAGLRAWWHFVVDGLFGCTRLYNTIVLAQTTVFVIGHPPCKYIDNSAKFPLGSYVHRKYWCLDLSLPQG